MAVFLVRFSLVGTGTRLKDNSEELLKYLPWSPKKTMAYSIGNSEALVFYYGAALDREPIKISQEEIILCHGYGSRGLERRIASAFTSGAALDLTDFPEAFCSIRISLDRVDFGGSAVGTDPLFYFEDGNSLIVTNRHNLLGHWVSNPSLRKDAFAWMAGRAHIGDFGTYWDDIKKTRPGSVYRKISKNPLRETKADFRGLFAPIANGDIPHYVEEVSLEFKTILDSSSREARLWLSGGKDSRAILGLISGSSRFSSMSFQTHGEKFAPDAMSATRVADTIGVASRHSVVRSSMSSPSIDISSAIARDLLSDSSGGALADFRSIPQSDLLIFGGHENGFKTKPNFLDLDGYLKSRTFWSDGNRILLHDAYSRIHNCYLSELRELIADAPVSRYPQIDALIFRNGTYLSGSQVNAHVSRSEIHPFLDGRMVRLLLGVSDDALKNQLIHYVMMRQSERPIETTPFAADSWPEGTEQLAKSIGLPFRGAPQSPYNFQPYFPTQKVFGGYSWRLDLIRRTKEFVSSYIADNYGFFDFIDRERLIELASRDESSLKITDFYYHLSLLKMCLVHYFGSGMDLFRFNELDSMAVKISCLFDATATKSTSHAEVLQAYNQKLDNYENALASIAEQNASQSIGAEKIDEIPILIKHFSNYGSALDAALRDFGFTDILREGLLLGTYRGPVRISGELISRESKPNRVLISIRGLKQSSSVIGFSWSVMADFWFKYLDTESVHSRFDILISDLNEDYQIMIEHWYATSPIFVRASCAKI